MKPEDKKIYIALLTEGECRQISAIITEIGVKSLLNPEIYYYLN